MLFDFVLLDKLRAARHIAVFTGAGVSAESGIPTFRDAQTGLWAQYRAEDLATPEAFRRDPLTVWNWYAWRRELMRTARPNAAHRAIARLEKLVERVTVITQNVDGLHKAAGSNEVVELHGNIWDNVCSQCRRQAERDADNSEVPPLCRSCGGFLRPGVVWFGEALPADEWAKASDVLEAADVFFLCRHVEPGGTGGQPAALCPLLRPHRDTGQPGGHQS